MALLTSLMYGFGGYGAGKQQRFQDQEEQQKVAQGQSYLDLDKQKQQLAVDAYTRNRGLDPATNKPFLLPPNLAQVVPNNKGKAATDPQTLAHLYALANWYTQNGQTDLAASTLDRAKAMESDIRANNALILRQQLDFYNQEQSDQRTAAIIGGANSRNQNTTDAALQRTLDIIQGANQRNIRTTDTAMADTAARDITSTTNNMRTTGVSRQNALDNIAQRNAGQTNLFMRGYEAQNAIATRTGKTVPYPTLDAFKRNLSSNIGVVAQDPSKLDGLLKGLDAHAKDYDPEWVKYAKDELRQAAKSAGQIGGSQAAENPPPSPWP